MISKKKHREQEILNVILVVIIIVLIIISLGLFTSNEVKEEKKILEVDEKQDRLKEIEERISELSIRKSEIDKKEKRYLLFARMSIGLLLILINYLYLHFVKHSYELSEIVGFNGAIMLGYSFFAFIVYGTPANLVASLKAKIFNSLKKKKIDVIGEIEQLKKESESLKNEIEIYNINKA